MYIALSIAAIVVAILFIVSPRFGQGLYRKLIFAPDIATEPYPPTPLGGIRPQDVWLRSSSGTKIHARFYRNPRTSLIFIVSHGNGGNVDTWSMLAEELLATGASVFLFDYQGYGLSEGSATIRGACADGIAAYKYVTGELGFKPGHVIAYGASLGSGVTCHYAARYKVGALVLNGAFSSLRLVATELLPLTRFVPDIFFFRPRMDNVASLKKITVPLRMVHGEWDELFGRHHPNALMAVSASADKRCVFMPQCGHMGRDEQHQQVVQEVVDLLSR